jgi:hypothetical protein
MKTKTAEQPAIVTTDIEWSDEELAIVTAKAGRAGLSVENYLRACLGYPPI